MMGDLTLPRAKTLMTPRVQYCLSLGDKEYCNRTSASMTWNNKVLEFNVFGFGPILVKRYKKGQQLVWDYVRWKYDLHGSNLHIASK